MNAIMYVCIGTGFEGVYLVSEHWPFEGICRPRDIGIRGDWLSSGYWFLRIFVHLGTFGIGGDLSTSGPQLDLILPPCVVGICFCIFGYVYV